MPKLKERAKAAEESTRLQLGGKRLIAIDPGDIHVGWAEFGVVEGQTRCLDAHEEWRPDQAADALARSIGRGDVGVVVLERFQLYADKAMAQVGSDMATAEMIGVVKFLVRVHNEDFDAKSPWSKHRIELIVQGAAIKKATRAQMKARQIPRLTKPNTHAGDAEEHGWCAILRGGDDAEGS